jgi:Flp pilus assembly protein TadB
MLLNLFFSIFGLIIGLRTTEQLIEYRLVAIAQRQTLHILVLLVSLVLGALLRKYPTTHWLVLLAVFLLPGVLFQLQELRRKVDFERNILSFLDSLIVRLRAGQSLKVSVQELGQNFKGPSRFYFQEIGSLLSFSAAERKPSKDRLFDETARELIDVHKTTHRSVEKLKAFRRKVKTEQEFRQKSRQMTLQVKAQSFILSLLFVTLVLYTMFSYDFIEIQKVLCVSLGLFGFGLVVSFRVLGRFKWTV